MRTSPHHPPDHPPRWLASQPPPFVLSSAGMTPSEPPPPDRRMFRRVKAPVLVRPARRVTQLPARRVADISQGGFRAYSDERHAAGSRLEVELFFPEGGSAVALAEVVWTETLPEGSAARYDVGLRFVEARREDLVRILELLA